MKVFWRSLRSHKGPAEIVQARKDAPLSKISDGLVQVSLISQEALFSITEYKVDGFSLSVEELETLVEELRNPKTKRVGNSRNPKTKTAEV